MDFIDEKIIRLLSQNSKLTQTEISEKVGTSLASCQRRIKALEESGVILGYKATIDPKYIGESLLIFVLITLERHSHTDVKKFESAITAHPNIKEVFHIAGEYDFIIKVAVKDISAYQNFNYNFLNSLTGMSRTQSIISLSDRKAFNN